MRPIFVAGNWKMNMLCGSVDAWAERVRGASVSAEVIAAVFPPAVYLERLNRALANSVVRLGGQNLYEAEHGAFTGELSPGMLADVGCTYALIGHSERRHIFGETDATIRRKTAKALESGLQPVVCVGELLGERDHGETMGVVSAQIESAYAGLSEEQARQITLAYEPVWAIGTGRTATPEQAEEVHLHIRKALAIRYNARLADETVIQYGGSVKPSNAAELLRQPNVDGLLVGGASLKADDFLAILSASGPAST